ncbi:MAG: hypothetical protein L6R40_001672 [Gallowayella cf. fulva]|nr:MAG: hypothetical protein L6R40_001672 [Xanthomendoza cf. fulva]
MMAFPAHESNGESSIQQQTQAAIENALHEMKSKKRKREIADSAPGGQQSSSKRGSVPVMNGSNHEGGMYLGNLQQASDSNDFDISQHLQAATANHGLPNTSHSGSTTHPALTGIMPQMTVPQPTDLSFNSTGSNTDVDRQFESSFDMSADNGQGHNGQGSSFNLNSFPGSMAAQVQAARESSSGGGGGHKPSTRYQYIAYMSNDRPVTVERRRRETINEGINELAKIVPGCEKNKGSILQRAVEYITQLRANEARNIEKFTREKMLMDGVVQELSTSVDSLKAELDRANREAAVWKKIAVDAGLESKGDDGTADAEAEGDTDT